jgi:7-cyano-7-deazaguanine synthase
MSDALVLFSGGQDSATILAWALDRFERVETIGFNYGQRHVVELSVRPGLAAAIAGVNPAWQRRLGPDHLINMALIKELGDTAMTSESEIKLGLDGLPTTFVPGRNLLFFTAASALAYRRNLRHLVGGMCETDYSGYPDCRDDTIKALQVAINLGMDRRFILETPLMRLDKAETWGLAESLGGKDLVEIIRRDSHSCYRGVRDQTHEWGAGCGECPACDLRRQGWKRYKRIAA